MDLNIVQVILVIIVAFLAGMEGILDEFQFHQPEQAGGSDPGNLRRRCAEDL